MAVVAGVVAAGVAMPAVGSVAAVTNTAIDSFEAFPTKLADPVLPQRSTLTDAKGRRIAYLFEQNRVNVPIRTSPRACREAIVSIEDSRFYEHNGLMCAAPRVRSSPTRVRQHPAGWLHDHPAVREDDPAEQRQDQDPAGSGDRAEPERKLREARFAIAMEKNKTKEQILNGYLNIACTSGPVRTASRRLRRPTSASRRNG